MFLQGRWVRAYPALAREIGAGGHLIGNHSHFHARMPMLTARALASDVLTATSTIRDVVGVDPRPWFRCPFGAIDSGTRTLAGLARLGYRNVGWNVDSRDWASRAPAGEIRRVVDGVLAHGDGAIVLMHGWPWTTAEALPIVISELRSSRRRFRDGRPTAPPARARRLGLRPRTVRATPAAAARDLTGASPLVLGIDGGNSKVDVALVGADGTLVAAARAPTISHQAVGIDEGMARLDRLVRQVSADAGIELPVEVAVASLAGADYPEDVELLRAGIEGLGLARDVVVVNDTIGAFRAGASGKWGVALVCGKGINAAAIAPDGREARFPGVGDIAGDWGGGGGVGMAALQAAVRGSDGRGPRTSLERGGARPFRPTGSRLG